MSDIIAFFIILLGFFVSFFHIISKIFGIEIPAHPGFKNPDKASSTIPVQRYNSLVNSKGIGSVEPALISEVTEDDSR